MSNVIAELGNSIKRTDLAVFRAGDVGIGRAASHGWRNPGTATARLLFFNLPVQQGNASADA